MEHTVKSPQLKKMSPQDKANTESHWWHRIFFEKFQQDKEVQWSTLQGNNNPEDIRSHVRVPTPWVWQMLCRSQNHQHTRSLVSKDNN